MIFSNESMLKNKDEIIIIIGDDDRAGAPHGLEATDKFFTRELAHYLCLQVVTHDEQHGLIRKVRVRKERGKRQDARDTR